MGYRGNKQPNSRRAGGFTLVEIIVVIVIIVLLAAVLLPALGAAKRNAKRTAGTVQMQGISTAIEAFYTEFHTLPGPVPTVNFDSSTLNAEFSESQNLFTAMSRRYYVAGDTIPGPANAKPVNGTNPLVSISTEPSVKPLDRAPYGAATDKPYDAYLSPKPGETTPSIVGTKLEYFPALSDNKIAGDGLPILYFRALRKYDAAANPAQTRLSATNISANPTVFTTSSNILFQKLTTDGTIKAEFPALVDSKISAYLSDVTTSGYLHKALFDANAAGTSFSQKGSYVLISPGLDRIYGDDGNGKCDDIVVSGGN